MSNEVYSVYEIIETLVVWVKEHKDDEIPVKEFNTLIKESIEAY